MKSTTPHAKTLFEKCSGDCIDHVREAVHLAGGAAYIVCPEMLQANVSRLRAAITSVYANSVLAYSYKTNYSRLLVDAARRAGAFSEVVSDVELSVARRFGAADSEIVFNGPGKTTSILHGVMESEVTLIADSLEELYRIIELRDSGVPLNARLGLRVAPALSFESGASRFGVDLEDRVQRAEILALIRERALPVCGIHLHITGDRSAASYLERLDYLAHAWSSLDIGPPDFLDCGGGFASAMPQEVRSQLRYEVASLEEYGEALGAKMQALYPEGGVQLICEPGTGILSDVGVFVTPVLDVKRIAGRSIAVVDGTYLCINPLRSPGMPAMFRIPCAAGAARASVAGPVAVYGNSCMEIDLLADRFGDSLSIGDIVVFAQKGAYASCMATPFIQGVPALVSIDADGQVNLQRERTGASDLINLN